MWRHLKARFDKIKLRVLHPGISAHHTVDILRGLPERNRLSPTLFGIFVADLVHELRAKFPHNRLGVIYRGQQSPNPHTLRPGSTTHIWIGGLLYVDDLALMSICPRELQSMRHACQHWSIRNRMQINTGKTKIMAFFETPALLRARGGQHQPGPPMPPFYVYSPFQPPTLARTLSTKSPNLSTLALFWILNSLCTSQLWKPYAVLPRVRSLL
jgi:hypothetical protein